MSTRRWLGTAVPIAQVTDYLFGGTWEATDVINVTINNKTVTIVAGSTTITTIIDLIVTTLAALDDDDYPEFAEITFTRSGNNLRGTADTAGVPFTCTVATTETGGGAADAQTIDGAGTSTGTNTVASAGPNHWDDADNWSGSAVPVNSDDVYVENSDVPILYGLDQGAVTLTSLNIPNSYTGAIGLPRWRTNDNGGTYAEYRTQYLTIGATTVNIGHGLGSGSSRIKLDNSNIQTTLSIQGSGQGQEDGVEAILWVGTHASNAINIRKGQVGIAVFGGEAATVATLRLSYKDSLEGDVQVRLGAGVTLTTVEQSGGTAEINAGFTTLTKTNGLTTLQAGNITTLNLDGGTTWYNGVGTLTTVEVGSDALFDASQDLRAFTISALNVYGGGKFRDPHKRATLTAGLDMVRCGGRFTTEDGTEIDLGTHYRITRGSVA